MPRFPEPLADAFGQLASIAGTIALLGVVLLVLVGFAVLKLDGPWWGERLIGRVQERQATDA